MTVRRLDERPSLTRLFAKGAITARGRHGDRLPDIQFELTEQNIDRQQLASYAQVCSFRQSDVLPPTYPHIIGFPAAVLMMVDPAFPFALPGLVHVTNRIEQKRALRADEVLSVRVRADNLRDHRRGRQFDMMTEVTAQGEQVWTETSTYLRREKKSSSPEAPVAFSPSAGTRAAWGDSPPSAIWRVPGDIGRRYAAVSGDVNPIHLNPLAARLFGFPRAIAHGMWVKARCLAQLEGRLSDSLIAEVEFKSPLLLPSTVAFTVTRVGDGWSLALTQARGGRQHLSGRVSG